MFKNIPKIGLLLILILLAFFLAEALNIKEGFTSDEPDEESEEEQKEELMEEPSFTGAPY